MPDWLFFSLSFLVSLIIYYYLPDEAKSSIKKFLSAYGFYIGIFIAWLYFRGRWGLVIDDPERWPADMNYATFIFAFVFGLYQIARLWLYENRYKTTQFICNNLSGSCYRRQDIGDWTIFFLGTSGASDNHFVIPWPLPEKIVVVPKNSWDFLGSQMVSTAQVFKRDEYLGVYELPEEVSHFLETDQFARFAKSKVYFGIYSEQLRTEDPEVNWEEGHIIKLNTRINELAKMLGGKMKSVKGFVSDTLSTVDKLRGNKWNKRRAEDAPIE